ncbi:hypothetical protein C8R45DRAFT_1041088 [Mycena sanguinolenta]|nr:hypothetical protein C8R45DRAFT_1041088 [Mycena sanguinolenta]
MISPVVRDARPLPKRRRLNPAPTPQPTFVSSESIPATKSAPAAVCASCHRAATIRPLLVCTRCNASTCAVCSRTCTTRSTSTNSSVSDQTTATRRPALAINAPNTNATIAPAMKRKKNLCEEDGDGDECGRHPDFDGCGLVSESDVGNGTGCGRVVCRVCCFESPQEAATTCLDCCSR